MRTKFPDGGGHLNTVHMGHFDIADYDIGQALPGLFDCLQAIRCLENFRNAKRIPRKMFFQHFSGHCLIVYD